MVSEVPPAWKSIIRLCTFATREAARVRGHAVAMHPVGFPFMPEEASVRGKGAVQAFANLALVWLQVGVEILAAGLVREVGLAREMSYTYA